MLRSCRCLTISVGTSVPSRGGASANGCACVRDGRHRRVHVQHRPERRADADTEELSEWGALARGAAVSLILIPAVGLLAVKLFGLQGPIASGLILLSVAAGAPFAVKASETAGGSPRFAVALTLLLGILTVFTAPATASWALSVSVHSHIKPGAVVLPLIALQWLPIASGVLIRRRAPMAAKRIGRTMDMLTMALVALLFATVIAPRLGKIGVIGWRGVLAATATALASWGLGWLGGGPSVSTRAPSAAIANARNIGLGLLLAQAAFPDDRDVKLGVASVWIFGPSLNW